jgi:hypothetical protein
VRPSFYHLKDLPLLAKVILVSVVFSERLHRSPRLPRQVRDCLLPVCLDRPCRPVSNNYTGFCPSLARTANRHSGLARKNALTYGSFENLHFAARRLVCRDQLLSRDRGIVCMQPHAGRIGNDGNAWGLARPRRAKAKPEPDVFKDCECLLRAGKHRGSQLEPTMTFNPQTHHLQRG